MALTEAQRFPDDFDGIIAGAPANFSSHQAAQMMSVALAVHRERGELHPAGQIHAHPQRGARGLRRPRWGEGRSPRGSVPLHVRSEGARVHGPGDEPSGVPDAAAGGGRAEIYAPIVNPRTRQSIFPGLAPGSELGVGDRGRPAAARVSARDLPVHCLRDPDVGLQDARSRSRRCAGREGVRRHDGRGQSGSDRLLPARRQAPSIPRLERSGGGARNSINYYISVVAKGGGAASGPTVPIACSWCPA